MEAQYKRSQELLKTRKKELDILAKELLEKEVLIKSDVEKLIGARPYEDPEDITWEEEVATEVAEAVEETPEEPKEEIAQ